MYKLQKELIAGQRVELELHYTIENDSFSHEFGIEKLDDYTALEDVTFDRQKHTEIEYEVDRWIEANWIDLEEGIDIDEDDNFPDPDEQYQEMREREMRDLDRHEP